MKKTFLSLLLFLIVYSLFSETRELWDLHFQIDVSAVSGFSNICGAETDGEYFYISNSVTNEIAKIDLSGNLVETFSIPNIPFGLEDLTTDGEYFYSGSGSANTIFQMDFSTHSILDDITSPMAIDGIAYDPNEDGFWITNWQNQLLMLIDRNGIILNQIVLTEGANGLAHQTDPDGNDFLWIYSGIYTGGDGIITQYQLPGLIPTGLEYNVTSDFPDSHSGGLFFSNEIVTGIQILGGIAKGITSDLFGYEIGVYGAAPGPPTNFTLIADPGGALGVQIGWTNPTVDVNGNPLTELIEIRIFRDDVLIYTDSSPIIGAECAYTDLAVTSGLFQYSVHAMNSFGGSYVSEEVWVGPDVPAAVTNFYGEQIGNTLEIALTWENPTTGLHSGPFLDPILGYHFTNDVTGEYYNLQGIMDSVVISVFQIGEYYFTIIPYNCVGDGGAATSNVIYVEITQADPILSSSVGLSNYPNPFNPSTTISFSLTTESTENTEINIYNLKGQKIKTLERIACVDAVSSQRLHSIVWDGRDDNNKLVGSGIFLYQLKVDGKTVAKNKMLLLK